MNSVGYVCAFRGRRDNYQVPLALQEAGKLEAFITDAYATAPLKLMAGIAPARLARTILSRHLPTLDNNKIRCFWSSIVMEKARELFGCSAVRTNAHLDRAFSLRALRYAKRTNSNLLLYSPYAWESFNQFLMHKYLFQYHPHFETEFSILRRDAINYPGLFSLWFDPNAGSDTFSYSRRVNEDNCWRLADKVVCASTFTRQSLIDAGAECDKIHVIPYGVELPKVETKLTNRDKFNVLFVGSGVQRKGLHHLLMAWSRAKFLAQAELTLVCRSIDPNLEFMSKSTAGVRLLREVSSDQLGTLYRSATLFAMPSLVEGFGQVYLEALSHGLPVLGTRNTCLPDLGDQTDGIFCVDAGDVDALSATLERLARTLPGDSNVPGRARSCAARFTWERFRDKLGSLLQ